ncbi:thiopeptide-type bacteriocin biosynthesis protein [Actinosynnema sp. NPDC053489]|uniref:thiopeptide-type bacteriocin biosynthesis protein n=1 Tax=Actinosynnema sp. NPDC053489 TaxID=3363916 RepID=UPI0037CC3394
MTWTSVHVRLSWSVEDVDAFITDVLAPELDGLRAAGHVGDWFYLRYWETGPHLRVRARGATVDLVGRLRGLVAAAGHPVVPSDDPLPHGDVRETPYEPEVERYGGPGSLPAAEAVFCRSTEVAVAVLRSAGAKFTAAVELAMATTLALGMDRVEAASWLRSLATAWRQAREPVAPPGLGSHLAAHRVHAARADRLAARWDRLGTRATGAVAYWAEQVRSVDLPRHVWASQFHMLCNRLGLTPEEERAVCRLVALTAEAPDGPAPFHEDGATAPDRRYLAASRYHPDVPDRGPREVAPTPPVALPWWPDVPLPEVGPPTGSLADALATRRTARGGELAGPLDATRLATLLWTAQGALPDGRRPYPSAGARHSARLRVVALRVGGLEPGVYEVDEVRRTLLRVAPAPPVDDVRGASMWFGDGEGRVDPATTPAVLALYARVGALRAAYGLRALRLAFTEAGHLAQNLALVAAASGLALGVIGGFHDDLAHDVLCLDGVNDTLVYLLPVAART